MPSHSKNRRPTTLGLPQPDPDTDRAIRAAMPTDAEAGGLDEETGRENGHLSPGQTGRTDISARTGLTRREVLAGLVFAGGCLAGMNIREALAEAARQGRPLLTQDSLASMMQGNQRATFNPAMARAMRSDIAGFLSRHFALTDEQKREIRSIPADQLARAGDAIAANEAAGNPVDLVLGKVIGRRNTRLELETVALRGGGLRLQVRGVAE